MAKKDKTKKDKTQEAAKVKAGKKDKKVKKEKAPKTEKKAKKSDGQTKKLDFTNIFTLLGAEEKHRVKPWQEVRHYDEVPVEKNRTAFPYDVDVKYDGNYIGIVVMDGKAVGGFSRTGKPFTNIEQVLSLFTAEQDGVYCAEIYMDRELMSLQVFSGCISPFRTKANTKPKQATIDNQTKIAVFDYITFEEFLSGGQTPTVGRSVVPSSDRRKIAKKAIKAAQKASGKRIHFVETQEVNSEEELRLAASKAIEAGHEGVVIKGKDNHWVSGHKNFHWMKIVKDYTVDLECIGFEEGEGKLEGHVGKLIFRFEKGKEVKASNGKTTDGDGYTHKELAKMFKACQKGGKKSPVGKIFRVYGLEKDSKGGIRLPKFGELRHDKDKADF